MKTSPRSTAISSGGRPAGFPRTRIDDDPLSLFLWKLNRCYCRRVHKFSWQGKDPLPSRGPAVLVSNHRSSVDPFILAAATHRILSFLIAAEYYAIPGPKWLFNWMGCVPVRRGQQEVGAVRNALQALKQGRLLCIFPEGGIDRGFQSPRLGVGYLAWRSGAPVIPACVTGTPRGLSVWRALVTPSQSRVRFGEPVCLPRERPVKPDRKQIAEWTDGITDAIRKLDTEEPAPVEGIDG